MMTAGSDIVPKERWWGAPDPQWQSSAVSDGEQQGMARRAQRTERSRKRKPGTARYRQKLRLAGWAHTAADHNANGGQTQCQGGGAPEQCRAPTRQSAQRECRSEAVCAGRAAWGVEATLNRDSGTPSSRTRAAQGMTRQHLAKRALTGPRASVRPLGYNGA